MKTLRSVVAVWLVAVLALSSAVAKAESKADFIRAVSGVWTSGSGLFIIGTATNGELILADTASLMRFKATPTEFNAQQDYLNMRVSVIGADVPPMLWTLRRTWKDGHKSYNLRLITNTGDQIALGFARELSADDMKIVNLDVQPTQSAARATPVAAQQSAPAVQQQDACAAAEESGVTADILDCLNAEGNKADKRLNEAYKATMARLSGSRKEVLRNEERQWIKARDAKCNAAGKEFAGGTAQTVEQTSCFVETTKQRIKAIEAFN
ncbi:lysozyme inhibitor LprI family protein [Burkholderia multivorans]|uniref:lysozyme inhibitor LprI family protein n=1 Tax=Burkholderia multivorans TaxID=87883 RepID=UPI001C258FD4|nr:lysozyme inhibitor LprI family protein [Burkholderia multivorans]MBU9523586.1 DUF1311 domain-containing protein [Burkholderia multivorans]MCO1384326.1 lysozyme inhibitor LprI family protein [Burkholderia multivorans]MCO1400032.1 lysozyme inhibitor LprI family protein [Burkholderia multivorans]UQO80917.1 lysozyme inhibitor LprI family protein [Burkholderia multivorans]